ncbi:MAG: sensor histidine kinase [Planctomycetota bacterium]
MNDRPTDRFKFELPEDPARRDRLAELGQLAGGLVHEIKNPLGAIDLNVQMLQMQLAQDDIDREKARRRLQRIADGTRHLGLIVASFLDFARPGRPEPDRVDVNALLTELLEEQREVFAEDNITISLHRAEDLAAVPADPAQLRAVFLNILLNGRDALREKDLPRRIFIATRNRRGRISVVIANNGPPLSGEAAAHLFDPFFSSKEQGTGLGLSIVHRLVELHGGRVWVNSDPDQGVSFTIELPTNLGPARTRLQLPQPEADATVHE